MNKSCRNILALVVLALSLLLSAAPAGGQNLSPEQQKKERCQINKNYIADYKRQEEDASFVVWLFSREDNEEGVRSTYSALNQAIANGRVLAKFDGRTGEKKDEAKFYRLDWDSRWETDDMAFQRALRGRIQALLDKFVGLGSMDGAADESNRLEQQIKFHENQLQLLGCGDESPYPNIGGGWESDFKRTWNPTSVTQSGQTLSFTNEFGDTSPGVFQSKTRVKATKWEGGLGATVSEDGKTITWDNGTTWRRRP